jgi:hypothetical protein
MLEYKRNQVEEAISHLLEPKSPQPTQGLRTRIKRLLEADRAFQPSAGGLGAEERELAGLTPRMTETAWPCGQPCAISRSPVRSAKAS